MTSKYESYALAFVSFVLPKLKNIKEIILFGSVARSEANDKSDIDLFFNTKDKTNESILKKELNKFQKSKIAETFFQKGIKNQININVGGLDKWKLKRSVISDGILLYGKYKETPEKLKGFTLFNIPPIKDIAKRNKIMRRLCGRKEQNYDSKGIVEKTKSKKISPNVFIISLEHAREIFDLLKKEKINYSSFELWSDEI
jgi:predicted nucleotidyltransferase